MRIQLIADETFEIKSESAEVIHLALLSGEINYRLGDNNFDDLYDDKLTTDLRVDSILISTPTSIFIKAFGDTVFQFRRE